MIRCNCTTHDRPRRIVLTGGPGAGKTAVLELSRQHFCRHVRILPESAGILFGGGFPRGGATRALRAAQRAIFFVQRELEEAVASEAGDAIYLCDRGTLDGTAYWPGPDDLLTVVGARRSDELARYDAVIHLRVPSASGGYNRSNPLRVESAAEAAAIDQRIAMAWEGHPHLHEIDNTTDFLAKAQTALEVLRGYLPACCTRHLAPPLVVGSSDHRR